jgi:SPP1 gp7 family putative phage head morphogenesis protein
MDEVLGIEHNIVPRYENAPETRIQEAEDFLSDPNNTKEDFDDQLKKVIQDILEVDAGIFNKVFTRGGKFAELYVKDGVTFTKNPDMFGSFYGRAKYVPPEWNSLVTRSPYSENMLPGTTRAGYSNDAIHEFMVERPAYFQYGWITGARPMPFGTEEIVYLSNNPRSDDLYGRSPVEILVNTIQMLSYGITSNLEYFTNNNIPIGVMSMMGSNKEQISALREQWRAMSMVKDEFGALRRADHMMPLTNVDAKFTRVPFSNLELQLLEQQEWFSKLVWACFGIVPSELGFTADSNRATEVSQSKVFKRKALFPLISLLENYINREIIWNEWGLNMPDVMLKWDIYDIAEDLERHKLFEIQLRNSLRTVNEIRTDEMDLDEVEGGDKIKGESGGGGFNPFDKDGVEEMLRRNNEKVREERLESEEKALETRVGGRAERLFPRNFEEMDYTDKGFERLLKKILKENQKRVILMLTQSVPPKKNYKLAEIKELNQDVIKRIKEIVAVGISKELVQKVIINAFMDGMDTAERELDMNFLPDRRAIDFLKDYTFDNIVDMTEELKNDLRAELERGVMNGEGITKLKERVKSVFNTTDARAFAIARTETNRASNAGRMAGYMQSGMKGKFEWVSVMDDRTSAICKRMNGKRVKPGEKFVDSVTGWSGIQPPAHVNCRSDFVFIPEGTEGLSR